MFGYEREHQSAGIIGDARQSSPQHIAFMSMPDNAKSLFVIAMVNTFGKSSISVLYNGVSELGEYECFKTCLDTLVCRVQGRSDKCDGCKTSRVISLTVPVALESWLRTRDVERDHSTEFSIAIRPNRFVAVNYNASAAEM